MKTKTFNIQKALERLVWRFKNVNVKVNESKITINELDQQAVEFLSEWVERQKQMSLRQNMLFAKLYCYALANEIEFYKDVKFANKRINEICSKDITEMYDLVLDKLNQMEHFKFCQHIGIEMDSFKSQTLTDEEQSAQTEIIRANQSELTKYINGIWTKDKVYKSLNNTISETLNKHGNE